MFFFVNTFYVANSQVTFDLGLKGDIGPAYFLNPNLSKSGTEQSYRLTLSDNYGIHAALNFDGGSCLEMDILPGALRQGYSGSFSSNGVLPGSGMTYDAGETYTSKMQINIIDIPFLYRYETPKGTYFEGGMVYEMISSVTYMASYAGPAFSVSENVSNQYPVGDFLLTGGLGKNIRIVKGHNFFFSWGARFAYGLLDLQGVDGHGQDLFGPSAFPLYHPNSGSPYYADYHETRSFVITLNAGVFYRFSPGGNSSVNMGF